MGFATSILCEIREEFLEIILEPQVFEGYDGRDITLPT